MDSNQALKAKMQRVTDRLNELARRSETQPEAADHLDKLLDTLDGGTVAAIEESDRIRELTALGRIGQTLSSASILEIEAILELIYEQTSLLMDTRMFYVALYDPASEMITFGLAVENGERVASHLPGEWSPRKAGNGRTEFVIRHREALLIPHPVSAWMEAHRSEVTRIGRPAKSWLGVPMIARGEVIGVIALQSYEQEDVYDSHDVTVLSTIASQAAIAIANARLLQVTQKKVEELRLLREVGQATSASVQLDEVLRLVVEGARKVMEADIAALYPYVDGVFESPVVIGERHPGQAHDPLPRPGGATVQVLEKAFVAVEDVQAHPEMSSGFTRREEVRSFAGIALRVGGQVVAGEMVGGTPVGVLYVDYRTHHPLTTDERNTMHLLATQAAIAISNARLFEASERRGQEIMRLAEVGQRILAVPDDVNAVLQNLADQALSALVADLVSIYPYRQAEGNFDFPAIFAGEFCKPAFPKRRVTDRNNVIFGILDKGTPHYAQDAATDTLMAGRPSPERMAGTAPFVNREGIASSAAIPLKVGDETVGLMFVNYRTPTTFDTHRQRVIELFASYAAIAIQNARLFAKVKSDLDRRIEEFGALMGVNEAITTEDLNTVLDRIVEAALTIVGASNGNVMLVDDSGEYLELRATRGQPWGERMETTFKIGEQGVTGWVAEHKQSGLVFDVASDERKDIYVPALADTRSELAVPLLDREGKLLGVISLESPQVGAFDVEDQRLLEALARQAVIAIQTQQRYEAEQQARQHLETLSQIDRAITSTLDRDQVLQVILDLGLELVAAPTGNIMLYDKVKGDLWMAAERGVEVEHRGARQPLDTGIVGWVARERRPLNIRDVTASPWDTIYVPFIPTVRSELAAPIMQDGELIGVINAESPKVGAFDEGDERLLVALASQAVVAIQNAERYRRLKVLQEIDRAIIAESNPKRVLNLILDKALELTGAELGYFYTVEPGTRALCLAASRNKRSDVAVNTDKELECIPAGQGVIGWCVDHRQSLIIPDILHAPPYINYIIYFVGMRSEIAVPLLQGEEAIGILNLESPQVAAFDEDDLEVLEALAGQAVIALQNAQSYQESEKARERFRVLSEVGRQIINAPLDAKTIAGIVLDTGIARTGAHSASVRLWDADRQTLDVLDRRGLDQQEARQPIRLGEGVNGWVAEHRTTCLVSDVDQPPPGVTYLRGHPDTKSELVVPLSVSGHYFGNLDFGHPQRDGFDADEVKLVEGLADQLAVALHRVGSIQALQEAKQSLVAAEEMTSVGQATFELAHRLGNDLGLVGKYVHDVRREMQQHNVSLPAADGSLYKILEDVGRVLKLSASLKQELAEFRRGAGPDHKVTDIVTHDLLNEATATVRTRARNIELNMQVASDVGMIRAVYSQALDILHNLIDDALEAMPEGGKLILRARNAGRYVEIQVVDTGVGIPPKDLPHIFDLFYSTKGSSGFGRWSAKRNAVANGGKITVQSEPGQGSTFTLFLPRTSQGGVDDLAVPVPRVAITVATQQTYTDTSEVVLRLAELERTIQELRVRNDRRAHVLGIIAHQARTPLANIKAIVDQFLRGNHGVLTNDQREWLYMVQTQFAEALSLLENWWTRSRIETGKVNLNLTEIDTERLISEVVATYKHDAAESNIAIDVSCEPDLRVIADKSLLLQALSNLLDNAIKFNHPGGRVTITGTRLAKDIEVKVADTGIGIPPEKQQRIWEWEYQVDSSPTREYKGIGYGLPIVKDCIERHGGALRLSSTPGQGSVFTLTLPIRMPTTSEEVTM